MINIGDILKYTTSIGGNALHYVDDFYSDGTLGWMVNCSYKIDDEWYPYTASLNNLKVNIITGHIEIVGNRYHQPIKFIREHSMLVKPRNIPFVNPNDNPYKKPKLFNWVYEFPF